MKRILIASDIPVLIGKGDLFHCLSKVEGPWCVGVREVSDAYAETCMDKGGWDVVLVNDDAPVAICTAVGNIQACNPDQLIVVVTNYAQKMLPSIRENANVVCIERDIRTIAETFEGFGLRVAA